MAFHEVSRILVNKGCAYVQHEARIVMDSDRASEWNETQCKANAALFASNPVTRKHRLIKCFLLGTVCDGAHTIAIHGMRSIIRITKAVNGRNMLDNSRRAKYCNIIT